MADSATVDLGWYPPSQTLINNLTNVVSNGTTGVYGFVYNSSYTPDDEYGTYNWCNMPHVRVREYVRPEEGYELVYVELVSLCLLVWGGGGRGRFKRSTKSFQS